MKPPWEAHPEIPAGSIGWRMGYGEDYLMQFDDWFRRKHDQAKLRYVEDHPEPVAWKGFFSRRM